MPDMADCDVYTSMAATEGRHFLATDSGSVRFSSSSPLVELESWEPSTVDEPESDGPPLLSLPALPEAAPVTALKMPKMPKARAQANRAPANAKRKVRRPWLFFSYVTVPACC